MKMEEDPRWKYVQKNYSEFVKSVNAKSLLTVMDIPDTDWQQIERVIDREGNMAGVRALINTLRTRRTGMEVFLKALQEDQIGHRSLADAIEGREEYSDKKSEKDVSTKHNLSPSPTPVTAIYNNYSISGSTNIIQTGNENVMHHPKQDSDTTVCINEKDETSRSYEPHGSDDDYNHKTNEYTHGSGKKTKSSDIDDRSVGILRSRCNAVLINPRGEERIMQAPNYLFNIPPDGSCVEGPQTSSPVNQSSANNEIVPPNLGQESEAVGGYTIAYGDGVPCYASVDTNVTPLHSQRSFHMHTGGVANEDLNVLNAVCMDTEPKTKMDDSQKVVSSPKLVSSAEKCVSVSGEESQIQPSNDCSSSTISDESNDKMSSFDSRSHQTHSTFESSFELSNVPSCLVEPDVDIPLGSMSTPELPSDVIIGGSLQTKCPKGTLDNVNDIEEDGGRYPQLNDTCAHTEGEVGHKDVEDINAVDKGLSIVKITRQNTQRNRRSDGNSASDEEEVFQHRPRSPSHVSFDGSVTEISDYGTLIKPIRGKNQGDDNLNDGSQDANKNRVIEIWNLVPDVVKPLPVILAALAALAVYRFWKN